MDLDDLHEGSALGSASARRSGTLDATIHSVRDLLDEIGCEDAPLPGRARIVEVLAAALQALSPPPATKPPSRDLVRALNAMVDDPRIASTGDLGRALTPGLNAEKACSLGGNRMRQMLARGWVVRERFACWRLTEEGRAAHRKLKRGFGVADPKSEIRLPSPD